MRKMMPCGLRLVISRVAALFFTVAVATGYAQAPAWQAVAIASHGSGSNSQVYESAVDANGDVCIVGIFKGAATFGAITLVSAGQEDVFVAKWSPATQSFLWAQRAGGTGSDRPYGVAVSGAAVYVAGGFSGPNAVFGNSTLTNPATTGVPGRDDDGFVAKLTDIGTDARFDWALPVSGPNTDYVYSVVARAADVYVTALSTSPVVALGSLSMPNGSANPNGSSAFVVKLADSGSSASVVWQQRFDANTAMGLAVSGAAVYLAGSFDGATTVGGTTLVSTGRDDAFVAKLTDAGPTGSVAWAHRAGGPGNDYPSKVAVQGGNVYVAGHFDGSTAAFGTNSLANSGQSDAFVAKLTDAGSSAAFAWAQSAGGQGRDEVWGLEVRGASVYLAGNVSEVSNASSGPYSASFGSTTLQGPDLEQGAAFVAKLTDAGSAGNFTWVQSAGGRAVDWAYALAIAGVNIFVAGQVSPPAQFGSLAVAAPANTNVAYLATMADQTLAAVGPRPQTLAALYPNPARVSTTVCLPPAAKAAPAALTLHDATGRVVRRQAVHQLPAGTVVEVSLGGLAPGLYRVQVHTAEGAVLGQRLVVE